MDAQIKEEIREASLSFNAPADDPASLSFVEKYCKYIQSDNISDIDSDCDFFPDDTVLREEYALLTSDTSNYQRAKNRNLSSTSRFPTIANPNSTVAEETIDVGDNGVTNANEKNRIAGDKGEVNVEQKDTGHLDKLIERLAEVRRTGPDGNSIFCTTEELALIQERYAAILDFLQEKSSSFERKDSESEEQVDVGHAAPEEQLQEKIISVQRARDRLNEVRNQVKELIEQLEIFERTKMENVG